MSNTGHVVFLVFTLLFDWWFWSMKLLTKIDIKGVSIKFFPFTQQSIQWEDIKSAEVVNYGFVGGWGVRIGTKYGTVYNTAGNKGLALILKNGKKICIGTQKDEEMKSVVNEILETLK